MAINKEIMNLGHIRRLYHSIGMFVHEHTHKDQYNAFGIYTVKRFTGQIVYRGSLSEVYKWYVAVGHNLKCIKDNLPRKAICLIVNGK